MAEEFTVEQQQMEEQKQSFLKQLTESFTQKIDETDLKKSLESISESIQAVTSKSVSSVVQAAIPDISRELQQISEVFVKGTDRDYESALDRLETIVKQTGVNLYDFSDKLGKNFDKLAKVYEQRKERIRELEAEKEILKEKNIYATIVDNQQTKEKELRVLTTREQRDEIRNIERDEKQLLQETKLFEKEKNNLLKQETLSKEQSDTLIKREQQLKVEKQNIEQRKQSINYEQQRPRGIRGALQGAGEFIRGERGSDITRAATGTLYETLTSPITAFKELGNQVKGIGGLFKDFGRGIMSVAKLFTGLARAMAPFLIPIALLTLGMYALYKGVTKLAGFLGFGPEAEAREERDKLEGKGKYQSLDEGFNDAIDQQFNTGQQEKIIPQSSNEDAGLSNRGNFNIGPRNNTAAMSPINLDALSRDFEFNRSAPKSNIVTNIAPSTTVASKTSETVLSSSPLNFDPTFLNLNQKSY
jgi:hypothetical protein